MSEHLFSALDPTGAGLRLHERITAGDEVFSAIVDDHEKRVEMMLDLGDLYRLYVALREKFEPTTTFTEEMLDQMVAVTPYMRGSS